MFEVTTEADSDAPSSPSVMQKQIAAFDKLTKQAVSRHSTARTNAMLQQLTQLHFPQAPRKAQSLQVWPDTRLGSIADLRSTLQRLRKKTNTKPIDSAMHSFFDTFLRDVSYLIHLKKYFDEKIYVVLYRYFYDASDVHLENTTSHEGAPVTDTFFLTQNTNNTQSNVSRYGLDVAGLSDKDRLDYAVKELYDLNQRWERILEEGQLLVIEDFEPDSEQEVAHFQAIQDYAVIIRLVPDVLVKCTKSSELARLWLEEASLLYSVDGVTHQTRLSRSKERWNDLKVELREKENDIHRNQRLLDIKLNDLKFLKVREERSQNLGLSRDDCKREKSAVGRSYKKTVQDRAHVLGQLNETVVGTRKYEDMSMKLRQMEEAILDHYHKLKLAEYTLDVIEGDYMLELEARPNFVLCCSNAEQKVKDTQNHIRHEQESKRILEKKLILVKTNHDRMFEIIDRVEESKSHRSSQKRPQTNVTYTVSNPAGCESVAYDDENSHATDSISSGSIITTKTASIQNRKKPYHKLLNHSIQLSENNAATVFN